MRRWGRGAVIFCAVALATPTGSSTQQSTTYYSHSQTQRLEWTRSQILHSHTVGELHFLRRSFVFVVAERERDPPANKESVEHVIREPNHKLGSS